MCADIIDPIPEFETKLYEIMDMSVRPVLQSKDIDLSHKYGYKDKKVLESIFGASCDRLPL